MAIIERQTIKIRIGKWDVMEEYERKSAPVDERLGLPRKIRFGNVTGPLSTYIFHREWENLTALEQGIHKMNSDREAMELYAQYMLDIVESIELDCLLKQEDYR